MIDIIQTASVLVLTAAVIFSSIASHMAIQSLKRLVNLKQDLIEKLGGPKLPRLK